MAQAFCCYMPEDSAESSDECPSCLNGVLNGSIDRKTVILVGLNSLPIIFKHDCEDWEIFQNQNVPFKFTIDELEKVNGLERSNSELWGTSDVILLITVEWIKKCIPGFEMKGPGWIWSADEASWKEVPKPNPDFVWSTLQTWERSCKSALCKGSGCSGLNPHFDRDKYPKLLGDYENSFCLFSGHGGNFCKESKAKCLCDQCDRYYDPHNPTEVEHHRNTYKDANGVLMPNCLLDTLHDW